MASHLAAEGCITIRTAGANRPRPWFEGRGVKRAIEFAQQSNWEGALAQITAVGGRRRDWEEDNRRNGERR